MTKDRTNNPEQKHAVKDKRTTKKKETKTEKKSQRKTCKSQNRHKKYKS